MGKVMMLLFKITILKLSILFVLHITLFVVFKGTRKIEQAVILRITGAVVFRPHPLR